MKLLAAILFALAVGLVAAGPATAACTTTTVFLPGGKTMFCTTCCSGGHCTTFCI